jgi:CubicO group peptidase (beta-lactamase class C family)
MTRRNIPGGALAVTRNGKLVLAHGYTYSADPALSVEPTSLFRIASLTKTFTSAAIFRMVEQRKLDLAARVSSLLKPPPPPGQQTDPRLAQVTVLQLLQHLGGWDSDKSFDPMFRDAEIARTLKLQLPIRQSDIITYMNGQKLDANPGSAYAYSNYGYLLLGRIIEALSGQSYEAFVRGTILAPLKIKRMALGDAPLAARLPGEVPYFSLNSGTTVYDNSGRTVPQPYGAFNLRNMDSHGAWIASAVELVRFASAFDDANSGQLLTRNSVETIFAQPAIAGKNDPVWYGCGWQVRRVGAGRNTWHNGSLPGTSTLMVRRTDGLNWAVVFNQREDAADRSGATYGDIDGLLHQAADSVRNWPTGDLFAQYL